jgi:hypothetical protein
MASTEQALMVMLRQLPISITITWHDGRYHWQCAQGNGSSLDLVGAVEQSLRYLMGLFPTATAHLSDNSKVPPL